MEDEVAGDMPTSTEFLASAAGGKACEGLQLLAFGATCDLLCQSITCATCILQVIKLHHFEDIHCFPFAFTALRTIGSHPNMML